MSVAIVDTGIANTASVIAALERCGAKAELVLDAQSVERAAMLVLPGVGAFGAGMARLREHGLEGAICERIERGRATLAICLGMQLLCDASEESESVRGLGIVGGVLRVFPGSVRRPQFGWNRVEADAECSMLESGAAYFANSYRLCEAPVGWAPAWSEHGGRFVAAIERGGVLACQFHPELSGAWGAALLGRWLARAREGAPC